MRDELIGVQLSGCFRYSFRYTFTRGTSYVHSSISSSLSYKTNFQTPEQDTTEVLLLIIIMIVIYIFSRSFRSFIILRILDPFDRRTSYRFRHIQRQSLADLPRGSCEFCYSTIQDSYREVVNCVYIIKLLYRIQPNNT